jgi:hypothetical protein
MPQIVSEKLSLSENFIGFRKKMRSFLTFEKLFLSKIENKER